MRFPNCYVFFKLNNETFLMVDLNKYGNLNRSLQIGIYKLSWVVKYAIDH